MLEYTDKTVWRWCTKGAGHGGNTRRLSQMAEKKGDIFVESHCQKETINKQSWNGK